MVPLEGEHLDADPHPCRSVDVVPRPNQPGGDSGCRGPAVDADAAHSSPTCSSSWPRLVSTVTAALTVWMLLDFATGSAAAEFQFVERYTWIESLGISWHLGVDGISLFLVVLTAMIFPLSIVGVDAEHSPKAYYAWLLVLEAGCMGVFLALDLFAFFVFFEIVLVPMYFLIGQWGHGQRAYAATKFFVFTMFGSALMLVGILSLRVPPCVGDGQRRHLRPGRDRLQPVAGHHHS